MTSIKFLKEQSPEVSILKKIQYPKNYIFAVYLHDQTGAQLALLSNKRDKPLRVLPLKKGENFDHIKRFIITERNDNLKVESFGISR